MKIDRMLKSLLALSSMLIMLLFVQIPPLAARSTAINTDSIKSELKILRGLTFKKDVTWQYKDREELRKNYEKEFASEKSREEIRKADAFLKWMALVPEKFDTAAFLSTFLSQGIAGYYDPKTKIFYLCQDQKDQHADAPDGSYDTRKVTALHEMTHALQDQYFDLLRLTGMMKAPANDDQINAIRSLMEGDATYVTMDCLFKEANRDLLTVPRLNDIIRMLFARSSKKGDKAPPFFQDLIAAPYIEGFQFIRSVILAGGWNLVNSIYDDLPDSTEQILHAEKYLFDRDFPWKVRLSKVPDELPGGWSRIEENTAGELQMRILMNIYFPAVSRNSACEGWGGDTYRLYGRDGTIMALWYTYWDTPKDGARFFDAYSRLLKRKYKSIRVRKEIKGSLFEAETPGGQISMEAKGNTLTVIENCPSDMLPTLKDQLWQSEVSRMEHPVKVKLPAEMKKKLIQSGASVAAGPKESSMSLNLYRNTYHGFSVMKPQNWVFKEGQPQGRTPIMVNDMSMGASFSVQVIPAAVAITRDMLEINMTNAVQTLVKDFSITQNGTRSIGGYTFCFIKGKGINRVSHAPSEVTILGGDVKKKVYLMVYMVPQSGAAQCEVDYINMISTIRFE